MPYHSWSLSLYRFMVAIWSSRLLMAWTRLLSLGMGSEVLSFPRPIITSCMKSPSYPYFSGVMDEESYISGFPSSDCLRSATAILPSTVAASSLSSSRRAPLWTAASFSATAAASLGIRRLSRILPVFSSHRNTPNHLVTSIAMGSHPREPLHLVRREVLDVSGDELEPGLELELLHPVVSLLQ